MKILIRIAIFITMIATGFVVVGTFLEKYDLAAIGVNVLMGEAFCYIICSCIYVLMDKDL